MKHLLTIEHGDVLYECVVSRPTVLSVRKHLTHSGMVLDARFDELPKLVREKILKKVEGKEE